MMRSPQKKLISILAIITMVLFPIQPAFSAPTDDAASTSASVIVPEFISVTLFNVPITFGTVQPGDSGNSTLPLNVTVDIVTNVVTNLSMNASDFVSGGNTLEVGNFTYRNDTGGAMIAFGAAYNGFDDFSNYDAIPAPAGKTAQNMSAYITVSIPEGQVAATYSGAMYIRVQTDG